MKYNVLVSGITVNNKEKASSIAANIMTSMRSGNVSITLEELINYLMTGRSVLPAEFTNIKKSINKQNWASQSIFMLDIDNSTPNQLSFNTAMILCAERCILPICGYSTFSSSSDKEKYRLIFCLNEPVNTLEERDIVIKNLLSIFDGYEAAIDSRCFNPTRMFFPGRQILYRNEKNLIPKKMLLKNHGILKIAVTESTVSSSYVDNITLQKLFESDICKKEFWKYIKENYVLIADSKSHYASYYSYKYTYSYIYTTNSIIYSKVFMDAIFSTNESFSELKDWLYRRHFGFFEILRIAPINKMLNLPLQKAFRCILPHHNDKTSSAYIIKKDTGYYYRCYGVCEDIKNNDLDLFELVKIAYNLTTPSQVREKIKELFGLVENKNSFDYIEEYNIDLSTALNKKFFVQLNKELSKDKHSYWNIIDTLISSFINILNNGNNDKQRDFIITCKKLKSIYEQKFGKISLRTLNDKLCILRAAGLINAVSMDQAPDYLKVSACKVFKKHKPLCYSLPEITISLLTNAQEYLCDIDQNYLIMKDVFKKCLINSFFKLTDFKKKLPFSQYDLRKNMNLYYSRLLEEFCCIETLSSYQVLKKYEITDNIPAKTKIVIKIKETS